MNVTNNSYNEWMQEWANFHAEADDEFFDLGAQKESKSIVTISDVRTTVTAIASEKFEALTKDEENEWVIIKFTAGAENSSAVNEVVKNRLATVAFAAGSIAQKAGLGQLVAKEGIGMYIYSIIAPQNKAAEFLVSQMVNNFVQDLLTTPILGVTFGSGATLLGSVIVAVSVAKVGQTTYNLMIANDKNETVTVTIGDLFKRITW